MILYKYVSEDGLKRFLKTLMLRFTPPSAFNDPFEVRPAIGAPEEVDDFTETNDLDFPLTLRYNLKAGIGWNVGILCLTEDPCQALMWAHYADCHQGAVIGFDARHKFFSSFRSPGKYLQILAPVRYSLTRSFLSIDFFRKNHFADLFRTGWLQLIKHRDPMFFTKAPAWEHEKEWRLVRQLVKPPTTMEECNDRLAFLRQPRAVRPEQLSSLPPETIRSITLGAFSRRQGSGDSDGLEEETIKLLESDSRLSHVELWKTRLHPREFSVIRYNLDSLAELERNVHPQEVTMRKKGFAGRPPTKP